MSLSLGARDIDLDAMAAEAAKQNKHLFVWLHKTDCGYCEAMQEFTIEGDNASPVIKRAFVFVPINVDEQDKVVYKSLTYNGKTFALKTGYNFYPSSLFMDAHADIVFAAAGYIEEANFLPMLNYVEKEIYRQTPYDLYRAQGNGQ